MSSICLVHLTYYDKTLGAEVVYRACSGTGFVTGSNAAYRPPGVPAHVAYAPRIVQPALMRRDIFQRGTTGGESQVGVGEMIFGNFDGALDAWPDHGFDGRAVEIIVGHMAPYAVPTWTTVLTGTMEQPRFGLDQIAIRLRDRQAELDVPLLPTRYRGTNELPAGLDGVAADLAGKPIPACYGRAYNVPAPLVNTARLIYQVGGTAVAAYDRGLGLTRGSDYTDQAAMEATAPAAGQYRVWPVGGYARLGSVPAGQVTFDVEQGAAPANRTAAQIASAIATGPGGIASGDVYAADVAALDAAAPGELGLWIDSDTTCRAALDQVLGSVGAWWGFDRLGRLRMARLDAPAAAEAVATLDASVIDEIERVPSADVGGGLPAWRATLRYRRRWLTQESDLAGAVTDARRAELREAWQTVLAEDASVKTAHPLAADLDWESLLVEQADAQAEADRRLALYRVRRDRYEVRVKLDGAALFEALDLGVAVLLQHPRYDLAAGKPMRIIGIQADLRAGIYRLTLWG